MITLKEYADKVVRPMVIAQLRNGDLDAVLGDRDCLEILARDPETARAAVERLQKLADGYPPH